MSETPTPLDQTPAPPTADAAPVSVPADEAPTQHLIQATLADAEFPRYWKSGSLKYDDFKPLAEGGTAAIQTCVDKNLNRVVIYKSLHPHLSDDEVETARFVREARVTAMIPHPGTVPLYEIGRDRSGNVYFTMKKLEGRDLRSLLTDILQRNHRTQELYPQKRLVGILLDAAQTVAYAHRQGVIHRDLKPANILVGEFGEVTVLDWGLAKIKGEATPEPLLPPQGSKGIALELTQPGRRFGTPLYMSPEQARGDDTDERTDIYALGIILYEILTGQPLVFGQELDDVLRQILERPTPQPSDVAPKNDIDPAIEAICLRCLEKKPADRYDSVAELIADLQAFGDDEPDKIEAFEETAFGSLRQWCRLGTAAWALALTTGAIGLILGLLLARVW